jgi:hypothetical protein
MPEGRELASINLASRQIAPPTSNMQVSELQPVKLDALDKLLQRCDRQGNWRIGDQREPLFVANQFGNLSAVWAQAPFSACAPHSCGKAITLNRFCPKNFFWFLHRRA